MHRLSCLISCLAFTAATAATPAATPGERWWGVIVGVGEYEHLDASLALEGPPNDVPLVVSWLAHEEVPRAHLTVLADHVPHADGMPTRGAILAALAALPGRMHSGDIAFLYFAGHGSQQPQGEQGWTKADGLDEIFLPRDVGRWDGTSGRVAGAIIGSEFGHAVDALRERGIFVWLVFDSCHSATGARALAIPRLHRRAVPLAVLGVPPIARHAAPPPPERRLVQLSPRPLPGGYVAFYAAQTSETEPEMPLPAGAPDRRVHGLLTYALLQSLGAEESGSYREVAHRILAFYTTTYPDTTPEFEGALDEPIGAKGVPLVPHDWPALRAGSQFRIAAGQLAGVSTGSLLTLYPPFADHSPSSAKGLLRIRRATLTESWADPVTTPRELARWHVAADRTEELGAGLARLVEASFDLKERVAGPLPCLAALPAPFGCDRSSAAVAALGKARALLAHAQRPAGLELTTDAASADLVLLSRAERLYVVDPHDLPVGLEQSASVKVDSASGPRDLETALNRAARTIALEKLAADFPGKPDALHIQLWGRGAAGAWQRLAFEHGLSVASGAELSVRIENSGPDDLDVTILSVDSRFGIDPFYPLDQESNRVPHRSLTLGTPGWTKQPGRYELIVIAEEARPGEPHDLTYLAQPGVPSRQAAAAGDFEALLSHMGFERPGTRAALSTQERHAALMEVIRYEVRDSVTGKR